MWNVSTGELLPALTSHTRFMPRPAFSPDNSLLATAAMDGLFKLWDTKTSTCLATFRGCGGDAVSAVWIPNSHRVAIAYRSGEVEIWNLDILTHNMQANIQFNVDRLLSRRRTRPATRMANDFKTGSPTSLPFGEGRSGVAEISTHPDSQPDSKVSVHRKLSLSIFSPPYPKLSRLSTHRQAFALLSAGLRRARFASMLVHPRQRS